MCCNLCKAVIELKHSVNLNNKFKKGACNMQEVKTTRENRCEEIQEIIQSFLPALEWTKENADKDSYDELMEWLSITITGAIPDVSEEDITEVLQKMISY